MLFAINFAWCFFWVDYLVDCGRLRKPSHGIVSVDGTTHNSTALYTCLAGYDIQGNYNRTCLGNGSWSDVPPTCRPKGSQTDTHYRIYTSLGGSVGCASDWRPEGRGFNPHRGRQHSFVEIDHEIFSTVILSLPLIQEGQLSVSGERMCTILVNRLED